MLQPYDGFGAVNPISTYAFHVIGDHRVLCQLISKSEHIEALRLEVDAEF
jgi:hypothetical protein